MLCPGTHTAGRTGRRFGDSRGELRIFKRGNEQGTPDNPLKTETCGTCSPGAFFAVGVGGVLWRTAPARPLARVPSLQCASKSVRLLVGVSASSQAGKDKQCSCIYLQTRRQILGLLVLFRAKCRPWPLRSGGGFVEDHLRTCGRGSRVKQRGG